ncbi:hypothetical protein ACFXDE_15890 [Kitasatospora sp. NPDC059408]|uniref:hypothetical protein n=1 Tax=Kitasatospora sp. NPDC059408 TaxID=3346823 RepID=UPI0036C47B12
MDHFAVERFPWRARHIFSGGVEPARTVSGNIGAGSAEELAAVLISRAALAEELGRPGGWEREANVRAFGVRLLTDMERECKRFGTWAVLPRHMPRYDVIVTYHGPGAPFVPDPDRTVERYEAGTTLEALQEEIKISPKRLKRLLTTWGVDLRGAQERRELAKRKPSVILSPVVEAEIVTKYLAKVPQTTLAQIYGVRPAKIRRVLVAASVPIRGRGGSAKRT